MHKEIASSRTELVPLATCLADTFVQRWDMYPRQLEDGRYICIRKPLKNWHLIQHLEGEITLGTYVLNPKNQVQFIAIDADTASEFERLTYMSTQLTAENIPTYLETSRRGGHLWFFFEQPVQGSQARTFGNRLLTDFGLKGIELFPKQAKLKTGPGSLIRMPFGIHQRDGQRYGFITPDGMPLAPTLAEQIQVLNTPQTVSVRAIKGVKVSPKQKLACQSTEPITGTLSQHLKNTVSVFDFVSQYIEISPTGRGLCPFHDDQHASFSVNIETNYWHCFAGCGGGSIIDFWMKWQGCDFKTAVGEMARMLLSPSR